MAVHINQSEVSPARGWSGRMGAAVCVLVSTLVILVLLWPSLGVVLGHSPSLRLLTAESFSFDVDEVRLEAAVPRIERRLGFITVVGEVRLARGPEVANLEAHMELRDGSGRLLTTDRVLLNASPLRSRMPATYAAVLHDHPEARDLRITFSELRGTPHSARWVVALAKE